MKNIFKSEKIHVTIWLFLLAWFLFLPILLFDQIPLRDVAGRYAPMAEAFARGDWLFAFHPRVPVLHPLLAGIVAFVTGCNGYFATKIISMLAFTCGIFPLYGIVRRIFDEKIATLTALMYVFASHLFRLGGGGMRDSLKSIAFLLATYGLIVLYQERKRVAGYLYIALGAAIMLMTRGECTLYAGLFLLAAFVFELFRDKKLHFPKYSILSFFLFFLFIAPQLIVNYFYIGYPVPEARTGVVFEKLIEKLNLNLQYDDPLIFRQLADEYQPDFVAPRQKLSIGADEQLVSAGGSAVTMTEDQKKALIARAMHIVDDEDDQPIVIGKFTVPTGNALEDFFSDLYDGFYPYFFLMAIPVIFVRIYRRKWTVGETILLAILFGHAFLTLAQIAIFDRKLYITSRYLTPVAPLGFCWAAIFLIWFWGFCKKYIPEFLNKKLWALGITAAVCILLYDAYDSLRKDFFSRKMSSRRLATLEVIDWIRHDYDEPGKLITPSRLDYYVYFSDQRPLIVAEHTRVGAVLLKGFALSFSEYEDFGRYFAPADYLVFDCEDEERGNFVPVVPDGYTGAVKFSTEHNDIVIYKYVGTGEEAQ